MKEIKRLNYFKGQFLQATDFQDEQEYHIQMRRLHNRSMHTPGIGNELTNGLECGLRVTKESPRSVKVRTGMAVDILGQEMIVLDDKVIELEKYAKLEASKTYYLTISYQDDTSDSTIDNICTKEKTRITEAVHFELLDKIVTDGTKIPLASIKLDDSCNIEEDEDVDDSISYPFRTGYVKVTGDTMTGPLKIDMSAYEGDKDNDIIYNLSLIAPEVNEKLFISINKKTIAFIQPEEIKEFSLATCQDTIEIKKISKNGTDKLADLKVKGINANHVGIGIGTIPENDYLRVYYNKDEGDHGLVVDSDGNVGIGTDEPEGKLEVTHKKGKYDLVVDSSGNIGLGTKEPKGKLHLQDLELDALPIILENDDIVAGLELESQNSTEKGEGILNLGIQTKVGDWEAGRGIPIKDGVTNVVSAWFRIDTRESNNHFSWIWYDEGTGNQEKHLMTLTKSGLGLGTEKPEPQEPGYKLTVDGEDSNAIWAKSTSGYAGYFEGNFGLKDGVISFFIDNPLNPQEILRHSCVESPESLYLYHGKATLNLNGTAEIRMPPYFASLTKEDKATVNVTSIGESPFLVGYEWNKEFTALKLFGKPNGEVAYLVLADRDDLVIQKLRQPVEQEKNSGNFKKGKLLFPEANGLAREKGVHAHEETEIHPPVKTDTNTKKSRSSKPQKRSK